MDLEATVDALYGALFADDLDAAREHLARDAEFFGVYAPDHPLRDVRTGEQYLEMFRRWLQDHPEYSIDGVERRVVGDELVVGVVRSSNGEAPHPMEGVMLWQIIEGKIATITAVPARGARRFAF